MPDGFNLCPGGWDELIVSPRSSIRTYMWYSHFFLFGNNLANVQPSQLHTTHHKHPLLMLLKPSLPKPFLCTPAQACDTELLTTVLLYFVIRRNISSKEICIMLLGIEQNFLWRPPTKLTIHLRYHPKATTTTYHYLHHSIREDTGKSDLKSFGDTKVDTVFRGPFWIWWFLAELRIPFKVELFFPNSFDPLHHNRNHHHYYGSQPCTATSHHEQPFNVIDAMIGSPMIALGQSIIRQPLSLMTWKSFNGNTKKRHRLGSSIQIFIALIRLCICPSACWWTTNYCPSHSIVDTNKSTTFYFHFISVIHPERLHLIPHADYSTITATATSTSAAG